LVCHLILGYILSTTHEFFPAQAMSTPITLSAHDLMRHRDGRLVVEGVSLALHRGEVLGLVGHNGAGKSTTLQMLAGALPPQSGKVEICGFDLQNEPQRAKACIGFLPEHPPLYRDMRVDDYLLFAARLHRMDRARLADALALAKQRCGLHDSGAKFIGKLSKGYQQRVGIAQAIIHNPAVVVLDEPTVGLDPAQVRDIRALIRELGDHSSVILSTHLLNEVESLCDRVIILQQGRLIYSGSSAEMLANGTMEQAFLQITENEAAST
jgi:ABC-2 type transport system ATP-binding protein